MTIIIRPAAPEDLLQIVDMQERHREEIDVHSSLSFHRGLCTENMALALLQPLFLILVAHESNSDKLLGYIWLVEFRPHYSKEFYYSEVYTYVLPSSRGSSVLSRLLNKAKLISKFSGAKYLQIGSFSGDKKLSRAYHKRYNMVGEVFNIEL